MLLFHDNLRDRGRLEYLGSTSAAASGAFSFAFAGNAATRAAAAVNDGYANFVAIAYTNTTTGAHFFTARQGQDRWQVRGGDSIRVGLKQPLTAAQQQGIRGPHTDWVGMCPYATVQTYNDWAAVNEAHSWTDMTVQAIYGQGAFADTDMSVGLKYGEEAWEVSGSIHVGNGVSSDIDEGAYVTGKTGWVWESRFRYREYYGTFYPQDFCALAPNYVNEAIKWNPAPTGDPRHAWDDSRFDGKCDTTYSAYSNLRQPGSYWSRNDTSFTSFSESLGALPGLSVVSQSGASAHVTLTYIAGTQNIPHYICGMNAAPKTALRVFAGT